MNLLELALSAAAIKVASVAVVTLLVRFADGVSAHGRLRAQPSRARLERDERQRYEDDPGYHEAMRITNLRVAGCIV